MARQEAARRHRLGEAAQEGPLQSGAGSQSLAERCQKWLILERRHFG